ncbi:hypothetical protein NEAUS03_0631 [Nematocida ausubeli]|nr:hypothetical protein NEAUS03_0631 [Nematocida ausubeli]
MSDACINYLIISNSLNTLGMYILLIAFIYIAVEYLRRTEDLPPSNTSASSQEENSNVESVLDVEKLSNNILKIEQIDSMDDLDKQDNAESSSAEDGVNQNGEIKSTQLTQKESTEPCLETLISSTVKKRKTLPAIKLNL